MFFIVSTGRSGTETIAELLSRSPDCVCLHEPEPRLIAEATQYLYGEMPHAAMIDLLRQSRPPTLDGKEYGESAYKLTFVMPALREAFPDAKLVWLIRDGRAVVESFYTPRRYYHPLRHNVDWEIYRPSADKVGEMSSREWAGLSRFEKCCWFWSYQNRLIEQHFIERVEKNGSEFLFIRLEELDAQQAALFEFLGVRLPPEWAGEVPHLNVWPAKAPRTWRDWSAAERLSFMDICGREMDAYYPAWRDSAPELWTDIASADTRQQVSRWLRAYVQPPATLYTTADYLRRKSRAVPRRVARLARALKAMG
ncbi:MAG: hypothetical protein H7175_27795 [Burkholderiales bacterium]|nr:hypothetical protein [Anaerolineae bacterium]